MVNVDLNALEIGAVLLLERNHEIQVGIDSCAAVTVRSFSLVRELPVEIVMHNAQMTGKTDNSGLNSSISELEQI